jgi:hypothetical protein
MLTLICRWLLLDRSMLFYSVVSDIFVLMYVMLTFFLSLVIAALLLEVCCLCNPPNLLIVLITAIIAFLNNRHISMRLLGHLHVRGSRLVLDLSWNFLLCNLSGVGKSGALLSSSSPLRLAFELFKILL